MRAAAIIALAALLAGCSTTRQVPVPTGVTFCQAYSPRIAWHATDTRLTKQQVDSLNRRWKRLCGGKAS